MAEPKIIRKTGFTLTELMIVTALASVCMVSVGAVFVDSQKAWNQTFQKNNSAIMVESNLATKAFEATVRKATSDKYLLDTAGLWVEVYYYSSATATKLDRYAKLYMTGGKFYIEGGRIDPPETLSVSLICSSVTACTFSASGKCIRMQMTLSDNDRDVSFICSAVPQNQ